MENYHRKLSHHKKNGEKIWGYYHVRLSVRSRGTFSAEQVIPAITEEETAIVVVPDPEPTLGALAPGTFAVLALRKAETTFQSALRDPQAPAVIRRQFRQGLRFWHNVLRWSLLGERPPDDVAKRLGWAYARTHWHLPVFSRKGLVLRWDLVEEAEAIYLSIVFGAYARTLHLCDRCGKPFVTSLQALNRRVCDDHRPPEGTARLTGLSAVQRREWTRLRARFNQRVHNGRMPRDERDHLLAEASGDLRRVSAGLLSLAAWQTRWVVQTKLRPGRRRKSTAMTRNDTSEAESSPAGRVRLEPSTVKQSSPTVHRRLVRLAVRRKLRAARRPRVT